MTEVERLQKGINGSLVTFLDESPDNGKLWSGLDAILIFPPTGNVISVKPYGYTPDELVKLSVGRRSLFEVTVPTFCFADVNLSACATFGTDRVDVMGYVHNMAVKGYFDIDEIIKYFGHSNDDIGTASCPYG